MQNFTANIVCINCNCPTAHHNTILDSDPDRTALQLKHFLTATPAQDVKLQVEGVVHLLWFHISRDKDIVYSPKKYKVAEVQLTIQEGRLAFLSGTGCASLGNFVCPKEISLYRREYCINNKFLDIK